MNEKDEELKNWDVTFVSYRGVILNARTEEEARTKAEEQRQPNERVGVIELTDEEVDE